MTEDDEKVAAYLESMRARIAYRRAQALSLLVDDPEPYAQLVENWQPLINFIRESKTNGYAEPEQPKPNPYPGTLGGWHKV